MSSPWSAELWRLFLIALVGAFLGGLFGHPLLVLALALTAYFGWHLVQLYRLERWLRLGRRFHPPEAWGIWGEVFHHIYRLQQRNRRRKRRLASILNQYQKATAAMPDATVVLGEHGEILWFNEAARALLDLHPAKDTGQRIDNLIRYPEFVAFMDQEVDGQSLDIPSPIDSRITLNIRLVPYGSGQTLLIARDVSQRERFEQLRRDFIGNVSHELRTPLTVVTGFVETLADSGDECAERWADSLQLMQQQSERMCNLVDDLLLLSRLETNREQAAREPVSVPSLLETVRANAEALGRDKGHQVVLWCYSDAGVLGAERELYSAFNNLATNAVRYTPEQGCITLRWWVDRSGAHFSVTDTGVGIAPEHIPRLTERFYRVDVGRSRDSGGTGLGLAIVKHVLQRHDARLRIESEPGRGSTFTCDIPTDRLLPASAINTTDAADGS